MIHHFLHFLHAVWNQRIELFWPIWIVVTTATILLTIWVLPTRERTRQESRLRPRRHLPGAEMSALLFLSVVLAFYMTGCLAWEDFTYYDNSHFTSGTLAGFNIPVEISSDAGRFWPLGYQEFNLLRHITSSITGYHALRIVQFSLLCGILLILDRELSIVRRITLIILVLITPSILISFTGLIYPEANVLLCIAGLVWSIKRFGETNAATWAVVAVICSQFLLYYKETAILLVLGFVAGRIFVRGWTANARWDVSRLQCAEGRLDICLAITAVFFLLYYLATMYPNYRTHYVDEFRVSLWQVLTSYLQLDLLVWAFVAVVLARIFLIGRRVVEPSVLWDGLALGGIAYLLGYIILRLSSAYYLAPVDLIAILWLGRLAFLNMTELSLTVKTGALALLVLICLQDISLSAFRMYERKNIVRAKSEMGHAIRQRYESDPQSVKTLFFPFSQPFQIQEFASYLHYIGIPVEEVQAVSLGSSTVRIVGKAVEKDGPCGYRSFVCHPGINPGPGGFVVILPDDTTQTTELNTYRQDGTQLVFSYHPRPSIPQWLHSCVNKLHVVSPVFAGSRLPDSWLNGLVAVAR